MNTFTSLIKSADKKVSLEIEIEVRRDRQVPSFDVVMGFEARVSGEESVSAERLAELEVQARDLGARVTDLGGMFVDQVMEIKGDEMTLRGLKKAILSYFGETDQQERIRKATETLVCTCRHVTDEDIRDAMKKGHTDYETVQAATAAGTGCGSCEQRVREIIASNLGVIS